MFEEQTRLHRVLSNIKEAKTKLSCVLYKARAVNGGVRLFVVVEEHGPGMLEAAVVDVGQLLERPCGQAG